MAIDERTRFELFQELERTLGSEAATTLMEHLPPVGWADVATRHDLTQLEARLEQRFELVDQRFAALEARMDARFAAVDQRVDWLEGRMNDRFAAFDQRFTGMETGMHDRFAAMQARMDDRLAALEDRLAGAIHHSEAQQARQLAAQTRTIVVAIAAMVVSFGGLLLRAAG